MMKDKEIVICFRAGYKDYQKYSIGTTYPSIGEVLKFSPSATPGLDYVAVIGKKGEIEFNGIPYFIRREKEKPE